jgi:hypothetical protein
MVGLLLLRLLLVWPLLVRQCAAGQHRSNNNGDNDNQ